MKNVTRASDGTYAVDRSRQTAMILLTMLAISGIVRYGMTPSAVHGEAPKPIRHCLTVHGTSYCSDTVEALRWGIEQDTSPVRAAPTVEQSIRNAARHYGVDAKRLLALAKCESGMNPLALNWKGNSAGIDVGLFQYNSHYRPDVSRACALDAECAADAAARDLAAGRANWVCDRILGYRR